MPLQIRSISEAFRTGKYSSSSQSISIPLNDIALEFPEAEIAPLGHLVIVVQNGIPPEQILAVELGDIPVAATDEKMQVDMLFLQVDSRCPRALGFSPIFLLSVRSTYDSPP